MAAVAGRAVITGLASGGVAGLLAGGIGSRVAMRVIALAGGVDIQGVETENGNLVGDITVDGTLTLVVFGAVLGAVGGLIYAAAGGWLPRRTRLRAPLYGVFMMFVTAVFLLDKENTDFARVGHPVLSVTLFALIPFLYGAIQVYIAEWLGRKLPAARPPGIVPALYAFASLILLFPLVPIIAGGLSTNDGPHVFLFLLPLALVYALLLLRADPALLGRRHRALVPVVVRLGGYAVLGLAGGIGAYRFIESVNHIVQIRS